MKKQFIRVKAIPCNVQGITQNNNFSAEMHINCDIIAAILANKIYLKQGDVLNLNGNYYTNLILNDKIE